jgi:hypothetical protein
LNQYNIIDGWLNAPLALVATHQGGVLLVLCVSTASSLLLGLYATVQAIELRKRMEDLRLSINRLRASEEKRTLKKLADSPGENTR